MTTTEISNKWKLCPPSREYRNLPKDIHAKIDDFLAEAPVRIGGLAERLGIKVWLATLPRGISSWIGEEDGEFVIRINRGESKYRQRFTLAHEIAHFLLHKDKVIADGGWFENLLLRSNRQPLVIEHAADRLAFDLIIPSGLLEEAMASHSKPMTDKVVKDLANQFEVSTVTMEVKLQLI